MSAPTPRGIFGEQHVDQLLTELVAAVGPEANDDLVRRLLVTVLQMDAADTDRAELKIASQALAEMHHTWKVFDPYRDRAKVTVFGSARLAAGHPDYELTRDLGRRAAEEGWMVITGAGPGIMQSAMEGARVENSFGVNIALPFEQRSNAVIHGDPKLATHRYFFTRKLALVKESDGFVFTPGGFGTLDESFELLTLLQTGKSYPMPVVLLDHPGSTYWERWLAFVAEELLAGGFIGEADLGLFHHTHDADDAVRFLCDFYSVYHSMRLVGPLLVLRLNRPVDQRVTDALTDEFADIIVEGGVSPIEATKPEVRDGDRVDLARLAFRFDNRGFGRLHQLIRRLNALGAPGEAPPVTGGLRHDLQPDVPEERPPLDP